MPSHSVHYGHIDLSLITTELWEIGLPVFSSTDGETIFHED